VRVDVTTAKIPVHSGMGGGAVPDAAIALNTILGRLFWNNGPLPIPGFYEQVRPTPPTRSARRFTKLPFDAEKMRQALGMCRR